MSLAPFLGEELTKVMLYKKPIKRPEPKFDPVPALQELIKVNKSHEETKAGYIEIIYNIARCGVFHHPAANNIPPWGPYDATISSRSSELTGISKVAFNPIIKAPPNDFSTVYTTLMRMKKSMHLMGQTHSPVFFYMGLLSKALEITWAKPENLQGVIPCEGGMHLLMAVMSAIGFLYADTGLKSLLSESGVFASGTADMIMLAKDFDCGLYALELVEEVLSSRFYLHFSKWCSEHQVPNPNKLCETLKTFEFAFTENDQENVKIMADHLCEQYETVLEPLVEKFREEGNEYPTFRLWDQLLVQVLGPLKVFLTATKSSNWDAYHAAKISFLPLLFAGNRTNYSRYMPVVLLAMNRLPDNVKQAFMEGQFNAKLTDGLFNDVWMDYALETTENKTLKGTGGIIGLTLRGQALSRLFAMINDGNKCQEKSAN